MKNTTKILLLTSKSDTRDFYVASAPPIGLYRLKHFVNKHGFECDVLDFSLQSHLEETYLQRVTDGHYNLVGISVTHHNMVPELELLWNFRIAAEKSPEKCWFIAGGQEATLNHQQWLQAGIDIVLLGYAERILLEFCRRIEKSKAGRLDVIVEGMKGCAFYNQDGGLTFEPAPPLSQDDFYEFSFENVLELDVPYHLYWDELRKVANDFNYHRNTFVAETVRLYTTSHCPHNCGFCSSRSFIPLSQDKKQAVLMLSGLDVFKLIDHHISRYNAKAFLFSDDEFLSGSRAGRKRAFELCELLINAKKRGTIPENTILNCQARIDAFLLRQGRTKKIDYELLNILKKAGFLAFGIGVETFSDRLLNAASINKQGFSSGDCENVLDALLQYELFPTVNIILFIPETGKADIIYSMKRAVEFYIKGAQIAVTTFMDSFPGSRIHEKDEFHLARKDWTNPYNGQKVSIADRFIPNDPEIADIVEKVKPTASGALTRILDKAGWESANIPKAITGLSIFVAMAELLREKELARYFVSVACNALQVNQFNETEKM